MQVTPFASAFDAVRTFGYRDILVPTDLSPVSDGAAEQAAVLARRFGGRLTLFHALEFPDHDAPHWAFGDRAAVWAEHDRRAREQLAACASRLGVPCQTVVAHAGSAAVALLERIAEVPPDLVVMTTHGRHGFRRMVVGSVADRMVRGDVPVLLVRPSSPMTDLSQESALHCANCSRLITAVPNDDARCPRCEMHLHRCANCLYWDTTGCVLQRAEAFTPIWPGRGCPRFNFRPTPTPAGQTRLIEADVREVH